MKQELAILLPNLERFNKQIIYSVGLASGNDRLIYGVVGIDFRASPQVKIQNRTGENVVIDKDALNGLIGALQEASRLINNPVWIDTQKRLEQNENR